MSTVRYSTREHFADRNLILASFITYLRTEDNKLDVKVKMKVLSLKWNQQFSGSLYQTFLYWLPILHKHITSARMVHHLLSYMLLVERNRILSSCYLCLKQQTSAIYASLRTEFRLDRYFRFISCKKRLIKRCRLHFIFPLWSNFLSYYGAVSYDNFFDSEFFYLNPIRTKSIVKCYVLPDNTTSLFYDY